MFRRIRYNRSLALAILVTLALLSQGFAAARAASDAPHHDIRVHLDTASGEVQVQDRIELSGHADYPFRLAAWLNLVQVRVNGAPVAAIPVAGGYRLELAGSGPHTLEFDLQGRLPSNDGYSTDTSSHSPDGSFLPAWDAWIPHDSAQPLAFRLALEIDGGQRAVSTGRLLSESSDGPGYTAEFEQSRPGEAPSLFVGPYAVRESLRDGVRLRTWFHPGLEDYADLYLESAGTYLDRYRALFGDYPYDAFHAVSAPLPVGLGFAGLTYIDRRIVRMPFMQTRSLAHEVLHSWLGNAVTVDYASGNWAEGLTTYLADYALERDKGADAARAMRVKWLRDYAALPASRERAIREFHAKQHQAGQVIGYNKTAFVFHMLEREIGAAAFSDGLRRFWRDNRFRSASWDDLRRAFEQASGHDLGAFFRQWIDQRGAPRLSLGAHSVSAVEGGYRTRVEVVQPVAGYRFGLAVELITEDGSESNEIAIDSTRTVLEWVTPGKPVSIHFDAGRDLFRRLDPRETPPILRDVTLNPNTQVRIVGDADFNTAARLLAARMLDTEPLFLGAGTARDAQYPMLLIVDRAARDAQLASLGIEPPAALPAGAGDASAWVTRLGNGTPLLVVSADSSTALQALARPLPHYGGQSYVLFADGRAQARGVWKIERGPLFRDLSGG